MAVAIVGLCLFALLILAPAILAYGSTHPWRIPVPRKLPETDGHCENVTFRSRDGLALSGWFFPRQEARAVIILCHGHQFNRVQTLGVYRALRAGPFCFLLFDFRRAGRSSGRISTIGADEVLDLLGACDYLRSRPDTAHLPIGVFGYSMGGAVAIMAAAADERIQAVAAQGAYASLERAIHDRGRFFLGVLGPLLVRPSATLGRLWLRREPREVSPLEVIGSISPRPVFIAHGEWDPFISVQDARDLYNAAREPRQLTVLPRSWHIGVDRSVQEGYYAELRRFFERHLPPLHRQQRP